MTPSPLFVSVCLVLACPVLSCAECDRSGCDALGQRAKQEGAGVGGVVAHASDVVVNGCGECSVGDARLELWKTDAPTVTEVDARALAAEREPDVVEEISERYFLALDAGDYLLCADLRCVSISVAADETLTVNLKRREGPTGFFVAGREDASLEEDFGFDVTPR